MARVAVVTGDARHRGSDFGALKDAGYVVAANYAGNDDRPGRSAPARIKSFKWDVSSSMTALPESRKSKPNSSVT